MPKNNSEEKKFAWLSLKFIGIILPILIGLATAIYFIDDRYYKTVEASSFSKTLKEDTKNALDKTEILLAGQLQQYSVKQDARYLDDLYRRKALYKKFIEKDPDDVFLKEEYRMILEDIKRVRGELTKTRSNNTN